MHPYNTYFLSALPDLLQRCRFGLSGPAWSRFAPPQPAFQPIKQQGQPDDAEPDQALVGEGLTVGQHAQQELAGGGNVLQQPNQGQGDAAGRHAEHQDRPGGNHPGENQQQVRFSAGVAESATALALGKQQVAQRRQEQKGHLQSQAGQRLQGGFLLQ